MQDESYKYIPLRTLTFMLHPDYSLNGSTPNRNEELESMELKDVILDAKYRIEHLIQEGGTKYSTNYAYSTLMSMVYSQAIEQGLIDDPLYDRAYYVSNGLSYNGTDCLRRYKAGITENEHFNSAD